MKLQFKHKEYQAEAVEAVVDCFAGQPKVEGVNYRLDPGKLAASRSQAELDYGTEAFRNAPLKLDEAQLLENIQKLQRRRNLPQSKALVATRSAKLNTKPSSKACKPTSTKACPPARPRRTSPISPARCWPVLRARRMPPSRPNSPSRSTAIC